MGDLVAYCGVMGSYSERVSVPASILVKLPEGVDAQTGAAALLQGMTAHYLSHSAYPLKPGDSALVHAGAGGTGLLLIQMAKRAGAYVFATVSTDEKAAVAREAGADKTILYTRQDFEEEVKKLHWWKGCPGSVRIGGQGHIREKPKLPGPSGVSCVLRPGQRPGSPCRPS